MSWVHASSENVSVHAKLYCLLRKGVVMWRAELHAKQLSEMHGVALTYRGRSPSKASSNFERSAIAQASHKTHKAHNSDTVKKLGDSCAKAEELMQHVDKLHGAKNSLLEVLKKRDVVEWMQSSGVTSDLNELVKAFSQAVASLHVVHAEITKMCKSAQVDTDDSKDAAKISREISECIDACTSLIRSIERATSKQDEGRWARLKRKVRSMARAVHAATVNLFKFAYRHKVKLVLAYVLMVFMSEATPLYLIKDIIAPAGGGKGALTLTAVASEFFPCLLTPLCKVLTKATIVPLAVVLGMHMLLDKKESVEDRCKQAATRLGINVNDKTYQLLKSIASESNPVKSAFSLLAKSQDFTLFQIFLSAGSGVGTILCAFTGMGCFLGAFAACEYGKGLGAVADAGKAAVVGGAVGAGVTTLAIAAIPAGIAAAGAYVAGAPVAGATTVMASIVSAGQLATGTPWADCAISQAANHAVALGGAKGSQWAAQVHNMLTNGKPNDGVNTLLHGTLKTIETLDGIPNIGGMLTDPLTFSILIGVSGVLAYAWGFNASTKSEQENIDTTIAQLMHSAENPQELQNKDVIELLKHLTKTQKDLASTIQAI